MVEVATKERPMIFNGEMVRAIIEGQKTQTRRVINGINHHWALPSHPDDIKEGYPWVEDGDGVWHKATDLCPYGRIGDRLWVRETYLKYFEIYYFRATDCSLIPDTLYQIEGKPRWRPSTSMPRKASRILLEIKDVRVERVQDISEEDAKAEGVRSLPSGLCTENPDDYLSSDMYRRGFQKLWDSIYKEHGYGWEQNLWVWVVEFTRLE